MCSTGSLGCGSGAGDNGGYGTNESIYSKKCKRQKVPKRGPGVAELEKILREQEKKNDSRTKIIGEDFSLTASPFSCNVTPNPLPKNVMFSQDPDIIHRISPPRTLVHANNIGNSPTAVLPEIACEPRIVVEVPRPGSGSVIPGSVIPFSTRLSNGLSSNNQPFPSPTLIRRSQYPSPSSVVNFVPHSEVPSSRTPPSAAGMCHGIEPPSSQTSFQSHHNCVWPEEEMMVGTKRLRQISREMPAVTPFNYQIPTFSAQMNKTIIEPSEAILREEKLGGPDLEPNFRKCSFLLFGAAPTPPSNHVWQQEQSKPNSFPIQESMEEVHKKPFYSFLQLPQDQVETDFSLSNARPDTRGDGIDLSLRL